mgnify:CR=1 FL=1
MTALVLSSPMAALLPPIVMAPSRMGRGTPPPLARLSAAATPSASIRPAVRLARWRTPVRWARRHVSRFALLLSLLLGLCGLPRAEPHLAIAAPEHGAVFDGGWRPQANPIARLLQGAGGRPEVTIEAGVSECNAQPVGHPLTQTTEASERRNLWATGGHRARRRVPALARTADPPAVMPTDQPAGVRLAAAVAPQVSKAMSAVGAALEDIKSHISVDERDAMVLLATAALVTPIMGYLKLSPVLGFLFAGIMLGPTGLGVVSDVDTTTKLAELGVVFFLFEMGRLPCLPSFPSLRAVSSRHLCTGPWKAPSQPGGFGIYNHLIQACS